MKVSLQEIVKDIQRHREGSVKDIGREWSDVSTRQEILRSPESHLKLGERPRMNPHAELPEETNPNHTLILDLRPPEL